MRPPAGCVVSPDLMLGFSSSALSRWDTILSEGRRNRPRVRRGGRYDPPATRSTPRRGADLSRTPRRTTIGIEPPPCANERIRDDRQLYSAPSPCHRAPHFSRGHLPFSG